MLTVIQIIQKSIDKQKHHLVTSPVYFRFNLYVNIEICSIISFFLINIHSKNDHRHANRTV